MKEIILAKMTKDSNDIFARLTLYSGINKGIEGKTAKVIAIETANSIYTIDDEFELKNPSKKVVRCQLIIGFYNSSKRKGYSAKIVTLMDKILNSSAVQAVETKYTIYRLCK